MCILENTQVLGLGRIRGADQARLYREVGLAETTAREKVIICNCEGNGLVMVPLRDRGVDDKMTSAHESHAHLWGRATTRMMKDSQGGAVSLRISGLVLFGRMRDMMGERCGD